MREQIRLWFYSQLFMSVCLVNKAPFRSVLGYEKMLDEHGRQMHGSWGNLIAAEEAFARMGADVMRWQYCDQPPDRDLHFGYGPAHEIKRKLLTFWNSVGFLVRYANIEGFQPNYGDLANNINMHGTFVLAGPGVKHMSNVADLRAIDIAPTRIPVTASRWNVISWRTCVGEA